MGTFFEKMTGDEFVLLDGAMGTQLQKAGLPVGVHFVGRFADESTLFSLAGQIERARPWIARVPPISARHLD